MTNKQINMRAAMKNEPIHRKDDGTEQCNLRTEAGREEYRRRLAVMWERQRHACCICWRTIRLSEAEFEHEKGRGMGGAHRDDRIRLADGTWLNGASCRTCNTEKGSRRMNYNKGIQQEQGAR
ncbi:MAG: hypothetical protein KGL39_56065 [Patescibacteria group bacterium]|nr:hypothetical protein [Patescibacteria group bacterium]